MALPDSFHKIARLTSYSVTAIALDWSYCIPIICKVLYTKRLNAIGEGYVAGPWNLGKFSWYINVWAVVWTFFVSIVFIFPTFLPVTKENMNYAIVILAAISLFAWLYWILGANKRYYGPRVQNEDVQKASHLHSEAEMKP